MAVGRPQKNRKKKTRKTENNSNEKINLDNEIIIGLTPKKEETIKTKKGRNNKRKIKKDEEVYSRHLQKNKKTNKKSAKKKNNKKTLETKTREKNIKSKHKSKIIKWLLIFILGLVAVILFMLSSIFNIKQIVVLNNSKISAQEIINLSTLKVGVNMFKTTNTKIRNGIKTNAYIEDVNIKRNLNGTVTLEIKERTPTYMLKFANAYIYINNQGYMLEISETPLELPIITGFSTSNEEIKEGSRLNVDDLNKLGNIIKIMETANSTALADLITEIDISDADNYILTLESEGKTVKLGEIKNLNIKFGRIEMVLQHEKGKNGEIYFQEDKTIFKEEVSR